MELTRITNRCSLFLPYTYGFFMCAFLLFPSPKSHNTLFYVTVLAPALFLFGKQFSHLIKNNLPYRLIIIFIVYCALSVFWSPEVEFSSSLKVFRHALYPIIFITITAYLFETNPKIFNKIFICLIIAAVIGATANIVFWYKDHPFPQSRMFGWGRFENPIVIGCCYGMIAIITVTRAFRAEAKRDILIYLATAMAFLGFILLTQSRLALISLSITLFLTVIIHFSRTSMIFLMAAVIFTVVYFLLEPEVFRRYYTDGTLHRFYIWRFYIWKQVLYDSLNNPFFGHGILDKMTTVVSGKTFTTPHSIYIGTLFYFGTCGLLLLAVYIVWTLKISFDYARQSKDYLPFLLCIFGLISCAGDFGILIDHPNGLWLLFWLPTSLAIAKYSEIKASR